jgi:CBS domain-containing membrane protein
MLVRDWMTRNVVTGGPDTPLDVAERQMSAHNFRHLPIIEEGRLVGVVSHRDLLRFTVSPLHAESVEADQVLKATIRVDRVMNTDVRTIGPDDALLEAAQRMRKDKYGCLPVVDNDRQLVGILTETDFVKLAERILQAEPR